MLINDFDKHYKGALGTQENWLGKITFDGTDLASELLDKYCQTEVNNFEILEILHSFNKNIIQVDVKAHSYKLFFQGDLITLDFSQLGTREKLFVICYMASKLEETIIVYNGVTSLNLYNLHRFVDKYKDNKYIEIVAPVDLIEATLKHLMKREYGENW